MSTTSEGSYGLSLSGGGFRATLFHLGVLRRLNEIDVLARIKRIACVSGGSLLVGFLTSRIPQVFGRIEGIDQEDWTERVSRPVHRFCKNDLRTVQTLLNLSVCSVLRSHRLDFNIARLEALYGPQTVGSLYPNAANHDFPEIHFLATDAVFGQAFSIANRRLRSGHRMLGYTDVTADWTIGKAAAVSACFPPLLGPYFPSFSADQFEGGKLAPCDRHLIGKMALIDGGLYDNLGTNLILHGPSHLVRLFSDAGNPLTPSDEFLGGPFASLRYMQLMASFIGGLRYGRVRMIEKRSYAEWSAQYVAKNLPEDGSFGFSAELVESELEHIRTDLDHFSDDECKLLENYGYSQATLGLEEYLGDILESAPFQWPYPESEFTDERLVRRLAAKARERKVWSQFGRLQLYR